MTAPHRNDAPTVSDPDAYLEGNRLEAADDVDVDVDVDEAPARTQRGQMLDVWLEDHDEPLRVRLINPDKIRWEQTRAKHGWPTHNEAPNLCGTFTAWAALKRTGQTGLTWEQFSAVCVDIDPVRETEAPPTR